jgi:hypothetical protein
VSAKALRILAVGPPSSSTEAVLEGLQDRGWASYTVETLAEAQSVLRTIRFSIVLAAEQLRDGRGYDLAQEVAERNGNLLVCVSLSESFLWLPVVIDGERTLGQRAINEFLLEQEVATLLSSSAKRAASMEESAFRQAIAKREMPPRRREASAAVVSGKAGAILPAPSEAAPSAGPRVLKGAAKASESAARARASK